MLQHGVDKRPDQGLHPSHPTLKCGVNQNHPNHNNHTNHRSDNLRPLRLPSRTLRELLSPSPYPPTPIPNHINHTNHHSDNLRPLCPSCFPSVSSVLKN